MKNAAVILGILGGVLGMITGFVVYGYVEFLGWFDAQLDQDILEQPENALRLQIVGIVSPVLAIAGGAMARYRALWGGVLMLLSCAAFYSAFGFRLWTMFPIGFVGLGGLLAIAAGKPDEEKAHF